MPRIRGVEEDDDPPSLSSSGSESSGIELGVETPPVLVGRGADSDGDDDAPDGFSDWSSSMTHWPFPLHVYPNGQHPSPHSSSLAPSAVVRTLASGSLSGSWSERSHRRGLILAQEAPGGQQRAVVPPARGMHVSPEGQQKLSGSEEGQGLRSLDGQVSRRWKSWRAGMAWAADRRA